MNELNELNELSNQVGAIVIVGLMLALVISLMIATRR